MAEPSIVNKMMINLRSTCKSGLIRFLTYYTGYPKDLGPSRVIHFTSEREFVQLLHQGHPVVVAFTIRGNYTKPLDKVLEELAVKFYPHIKFMCTASQERVADPNVTKYALKVLPYYMHLLVMYKGLVKQGPPTGGISGANCWLVGIFNYDLSAYGFREFFKRYGVQSSSGTTQ